VFDKLKDLSSIMGRMQAFHEALRERRVTGISGGGLVKAETNAAGELLRITIDHTAVNPAEIEMLEGLIVAAVADARVKASAVAQEETMRLTGGLNLPGLGFPFPGAPPAGPAPKA
jgi:nucleoid-associated protein EbfC